MHTILSLLKYYKEYLGEIKLQGLILKCNLYFAPFKQWDNEAKGESNWLGSGHKSR